VYPIRKGVPILLPQTGSQTARDGFYAGHYDLRSRLKDLESDYLREERTWVRQFIRQHSIQGLILEIGCGTGIFADCSPDYLGMDYSSTSVHAEGFDGFRRFVGDAQAIPLPPKSVDLVFSFNTLEHVPDPNRAFLEIDRVLKPGGHAVLHPAWNCAAFNTRLVPVLPLGQLPWRDKVIKLLLPILRHRLFKFATRVPGRALRWLAKSRRKNLPLRFRPLSPYLGSEVFIADCDATASIDIADAVLFFRSRGYELKSHQTTLQILSSGHRPLIVRKPVENLRPNVENVQSST
jgi:SAM-dependent methyltransferase